MIISPPVMHITKAHAAGISKRLKTADPAREPIPTSFSVTKMLTSDENTSGPAVPSGVNIAPVISGSSDKTARELFRLSR